jgi:hypothetical protein
LRDNMKRLLILALLATMIPLWAAGQQQSVTKVLTITVSASPISFPVVSVPNMIVGTAISTITFSTSGGVAPYVYSISVGSLPTGLTLSSAGVLSGTPTIAGSYSFTVQVADSELTPQTATQSFTVNVAALLSITTTSLPAGTAAASYSAMLAATGGTTPYTWSLSSGTLPAGLTLSAAGVISGTPTTPGTYTITVKVTDAGH